MERLTSEQIRLLEELRELRDSGILTVDEFEFQVAKVLGRPQVVEPIPFVEEPLAPQEPDETVVPENPDEAQQVEQSDVADVALVPDTSHESELLEYELVEPDISDEDEILVEENQVAEPPAISDTLALPIVETETQQNIPSRGKVLIGTTAGLVLIAVIGLVTLVGGGKSDSTSTQIIDNTTTVTQSTKPAPTEAATTSTSTTTEITPTTTYEVLRCPYTRTIEAVDGKIVTPEGITFDFRPATYVLTTNNFEGTNLVFREENGSKAGVNVINTTNFRLRIGMELEWLWPGSSLKVQWGPGNGRGWVNGFQTRTIEVADEYLDIQAPITDIQLEIINVTIEYRCP